MDPKDDLAQITHLIYFTISYFSYKEKIKNIVNYFVMSLMWKVPLGLCVKELPPQLLVLFWELLETLVSQV